MVINIVYRKNSSGQIVSNEKIVTESSALISELQSTKEYSAVREVLKKYDSAYMQTNSVNDDLVIDLSSKMAKQTKNMLKAFGSNKRSA